MLPPGWGPASIRDGHLSYRHGQLPVELIAERTCGSNSHPALGLSHCWELRYRHRIGEQTISEPIGRVSTRHAALDGLLECMNRIHDHDTADQGTTHEIRTALGAVKLVGAVPDAPVRL